MVKYSNFQIYFNTRHTLVSREKLAKCVYLLSRNHLAMGLAGGQVACCTNIWFLHLLDLGFVSLHHAVAGEYDLVTLLISLILYRFVTLFLKEML